MVDAINKYIIENYQKLTYKQIMQDLNISYSNVRNRVYELRKQGLIDRLAKPKAIEQWYSNEVLFLMKYYTLFGNKFIQVKLNKSRANVDYYAKKLNLPEVHKTIGKRQRQLIYLYLQGYTDKQIIQKLNLTYNNFHGIKHNLLKDLNVKNILELKHYIFANKLNEVITDLS